MFTVFVIILLAILALLGVAATRPGQFRIERSGFGLDFLLANHAEVVGVGVFTFDHKVDHAASISSAAKAAICRLAIFDAWRFSVRKPIVLDIFN